MVYSYNEHVRSTMPINTTTNIPVKREPMLYHVSMATLFLASRLWPGIKFHYHFKPVRIYRHDFIKQQNHNRAIMRYGCLLKWGRARTVWQLCCLASGSSVAKTQENHFICIGPVVVAGIRKYKHLTANIAKASLVKPDPWFTRHPGQASRVMVTSLAQVI